MMDKKAKLEPVAKTIQGTISFPLVIEMWGRRIKRRARVVFDAVPSDATIDFDGDNPLSGTSSYKIEVYGPVYDEKLGKSVRQWVETEDLVSEAVMTDAVSWKIWDAVNAKAERIEAKRRQDAKKNKAVLKSLKG